MRKDKINWGILSTAKIGVEKVIPALQASQYGHVSAIASRDSDRASEWAQKLAIDRAFGSYESLLADPDIDAIYNPLPNHLHVPLTIQAVKAGKHVLCEKPIALSANEAQSLITACNDYPEIKVMEAFMYRFHPQWQRVHELVTRGEIGDLCTVQTFFSYFNDDPGNIRNQSSMGGGGLMDIGCYPISQARYLYAREPERVSATLDIDERFNTDRVASAILDFGGPTATFTCSMQMAALQRAHIVGTQGRIEVEIPVNAPPNQGARISVVVNGELRHEQMESCDQYTLQADAFARAVLDDTPVPVPLTDAVANMRVIDAVVSSHESGAWVRV